jgi:DNA repair protein RadC
MQMEATDNGGKVSLRERMAEQGARSLSSLELVDLVMGNGNGNGKGNGHRVAPEAAIDVLGMLDLAGQSIRLEELLTVPGLGAAGGCRLIAAMELARRYFGDGGIKVSGPEDVAAIAAEIIERPQEHFLTLTLDGGGSLIEKRVIFIGTLNQTVVHPREVFCDAICDRAAGIVLAHNHPSGRVEPSREDTAITERLVRVGRLVGIEVVDHVIVGRGGTFSFKAQGLLSE